MIRMKVYFLLFLGSLFFAMSACGGGLTGAVKSSRDNPLLSSVRYPDLVDESSNDSFSNSLTSLPEEDQDGVATMIRRAIQEDNEESEGFASPSGWRPRKGNDLPIIRNARVDRWIKSFTGPLRANFTRWLGRSGKYGPMIDKILREYNLPHDLIYLAMIESGLNLNAYSHAHAAGPWQFIKSTGRLYGLEAGSYVDERRDIEKATRAAAAHLRDLYQRYGDWYLAFAAYNAGAGRVDRAIRNSGTRDFWQMTSGRKRYLRQETIDYVPRILAAAIISKNYRQYGFSNTIFEAPASFETVTVPDATDLGVVAECAEASYDEIKNLNSSLVMGVTPPGEKFCLRIPRGTADRFEENYKQVPASERVRFVYHTVKKRETLATIAKRYGVSRQNLASANGLSVGSRVKTGSRLKIPKKGLPGNLLASKSPIFTKAEKTGDEPVSLSSGIVTEVSSDIHHRVKRGESLSLIAKKYKVSVASLRELNGLGKRSTIKSGQLLKITSDQEETQTALMEPEIKSELPVVEDKTPLAESDLGSDLLALDVPSAPTNEQEPAGLQPILPSPLNQTVYVVQPGDSLWKISSTFGVSVDDLVDENPSLREYNGVRPHQKIIIPSTDSGTVASQTYQAQKAPQKISTRIDSRVGQKIVHLVRRGETLWDVSQKYRVSVSQLKTWNKLRSNQLFPNQKLIIYAQAVAAKKVALR